MSVTEPILKPGEAFYMCTFSDTVRFEPANYVVCFKHCGHWVCDPDVGMRLSVKLEVFTVLTQSHNLRWGSGEQLAAFMNKHMETAFTCNAD